MSWSTPPFESLPDAGNGYRWVGSRVMDAEEYRVEGWRCRTRDAWEGLDTGSPRLVKVTYWAATVEGMNQLARQRAAGKRERRERWAEREREEQAYADWVDGLVERQQ